MAYKRPRQFLSKFRRPTKLISLFLLSKYMNMSRGKVYIFVGVAGSGKTTLIKKFTEKTGLINYDILEVMQPYLQKHGTVTERNKSVLDEVVSRFVESFSKRKFDILELANGYYLPQFLTALKDKEIIVIYCKCPLDICKKRNKERMRLVPDHYLKYQAQFDTPYYIKLKKKFNFQLVILDMKQDPSSLLIKLLK